jgi:hypothetical protein
MNSRGRPSIDLEGKRFGKLTATNRMKAIDNKSYRLCHCDCGKKSWVRTGDLLRIRFLKSCGCTQRYNKLGEGRAARNAVLYDYKRHAIERGLVWRLTENQFDSFITSPCFFCGGEPLSIKRSKNHTGDFIYNGIDRLNNKRGYVSGNVVTCCKICNRAKNNMTLNAFKAWIRAIRTNAR